MTLQAVAALVERRRDIMREQAYLEREGRRCEEAIVHIDATIRLFDPNFDVSTLTPKQFVTEDDIFRPGEAPIIALEILREAGREMTINEIAKLMLEKRGAPQLSPRQFQNLTKKVYAVLNFRFRQGLIKKVGTISETKAVLW